MKDAFWFVVGVSLLLSSYWLPAIWRNSPELAGNVLFWSGVALIIAPVTNFIFKRTM